MADALELIKTRRSCKKYKSDMIPDEVIEKVVEAGMYAPTASGLQSPIIVVIKNKEVRDRLSVLNAEIGNRVGTDPFYNAPVVCVVLADKNRGARVYDGSCVLENMMLEASSLGIGSCWIHRAKEEFETEEWKQFLKDLGVEGEYEGIGHCILGYPDMEPVCKPRKENWVYYCK